MGNYFEHVGGNVMSLPARIGRACIGVFIGVLIAAAGALHAQPGSAEWQSQYETLSRRVSGGQLDAQSLEMARQLIAAAEQTYGPESRKAATSHYLLGFTYRRRSEFPQAEAAFTRAVAIQEKLPRQGDPSLSFYIMNLAAACEGQRAWDRAAVHFERAIALIETDKGADASDLVEPLQSLANGYHLSRNDVKAEPAILRALEIAERINSRYSIDAITRALHVLGNDYLRRGDAAKAVPILEREIALLQKSDTAKPEALAAARELLDKARPKTAVRVDEKRAAVPAAGTKQTGKSGIWPSDMEPGNLYFAVEVAHPKWNRRIVPIMISATSGQEAISRVELAHKTMLDKTISKGDHRPYVLIEGGECVGPTWGAVVSNYRSPPHPGKMDLVWGGACAKTPALAIEAAFAACKKKNPLGCDHKPKEDYWWGPNISLALSGRTSWSGSICGGTCMPGEDDSFGSFNAFTGNALLNVNFIESMQDAIAKLGKKCSDRPCYYTNPTVRCYGETKFNEIADKCTEKRLRPDGYDGPIR
jgi:tetratricopeptide (TPR) repeat protein